MTSEDALSPGDPTHPDAYPLFERHPRVQTVVPRVPLGTWPTRVESLDRLAARLGARSLQVKHDDLSAPVYGGNKVRKLEILLGDALKQGARHVMTFGAAGSNHALATAIHGRALGLEVTSFLSVQPNATYVRRNLLAHHAVGGRVRMHVDTSAAMRDAAAYRATVLAETGSEPFVIPFGGTSPLSTAGFVNAGLELASQVAAGAALEPDVVYVPLGSMGTAAGIALGLALGGLTPVVRAVRVVPETIAGAGKLAALMVDAARLLEEADPSFPRSVAGQCRVEVIEEFLGQEYARFTPEGMEAVALAGEVGLHLEGTYTGKTMAALLAAARNGELADANVLFWDTYNSRDLGPLVSGIDYHDLPEECHVFFESDVQPLDRWGV